MATREYLRKSKSPLDLASLRASKDPSLFTVLLEDGAALIGLGIAALGVTGATVLDWPQADGFASIAIGVLLIAVAGFLARETRSLLIGEAVSPELVSRIRSILTQNGQVDSVEEIATLHLGPDRILVAIRLKTDGSELRALIATLSELVRGADRRIVDAYFAPSRGLLKQSDPAGIV